MRNLSYLFVTFFLFLGSKTYSQASVTLFQNNLVTPNPMIVNGNDLYIGYYYSDKIVKFDLSNPSTPPVDVITGVNRPYGLEIKDNMLYVSEFGADKISRFDLSNPTLPPVTIASFLNSPIGLEFIGNDLYVARENDHRISKIDITQPVPQPVDVAVVDSPFEIEAVGDELYISERFAGRISKVNINNPSTPVTVVQGLVRPSGLASYGKDLFIAQAGTGTADGTAKILKINTTVSNPTASDAVVSNLLEYPSGLLVNNNTLYITDFFASALFKVDLGSLSVSDFNLKDKNELKIYPNPVKDKLYIQNSPSKEYKIFDVAGRLIDSGILDKNYINLNQLPEGNYIIKTGEISKKFIKK